ncbi:hypothetical protein ACUNV4_12120 [Granulosicoccus sp. 3-233]|uniref:hypothetical protein n=1 Tax=Granulosicoccus sp. 3-233 TaxID=3417969 RepID=UPI003D3528C1
MKTILALGALAALSTFAFADAPEVPTDAPYIVLSDNLDEPNGFGFCIDTYGAGQTDLMHTHTCKPQDPDQPNDSMGNDTRFMYNVETGQIASYTFEGFCMQALIATDLTVFAMLECSDHPRQQFVYDENDMTLHLAEDSERCVSVVSETVPAGPWVKRPLVLETCEEVDASLKQWTVVQE